jgi:hypothetical protein
MTIHFYLDNTEETLIVSLYDMVSNPFKIGDEIGLTIDELYPKDYNKFSSDISIKLVLDNDELYREFNNKIIQLNREGKYLKTKVLGTAQLTIEYHCELKM